MHVSAYLKSKSAGMKTVRPIVFTGDPFEAVSVQNWQIKVLKRGQAALLLPLSH
jgi:hypothetical protein